MKVKAPPTEYEHSVSSGFFPENDDVIERKLSNEGINSIGLKRAKRKQKTHNGDYLRSIIFLTSEDITFLPLHI